MDGKDVQGFQGHRVVTAEHVLVAEQVRKICGERIGNARVLLAADEAAGQLQPEQLASVKHLAIEAVAPAVEAVGFVPGGDFVLWDE